MKKIKKLLDKIDGWLLLHDPYYWWRKVKDKYPPPCPVMVYGEYNGYYGLPGSLLCKKGIHFYSEGLGWKMKFGEPCFEWNPIICITIKSPFKSKIYHENDDLHYHKIYWFGWTFKYSLNETNRNIWEDILNEIINEN